VNKTRAVIPAASFLICILLASRSCFADRGNLSFY
jgi:hypothetical protein